MAAKVVLEQLYLPFHCLEGELHRLHSLIVSPFFGLERNVDKIILHMIVQTPTISMQ